jgi:hypothetical protein
VLRPGFEKHLSLEENMPAGSCETGVSQRIRARVRFDYRGKARPSRFFFGGKAATETAEDLRQQQEALWRNVPVQGLFVENIERGEIYTVFDEESEGEVAFAPLEMTVQAEAPADLIRFAARDEFRYLRILEPERLTLSGQDMERIFYQAHEQMRTQVYLKAKRLQE